jgi:3-oxoacyl-[acyl-carrier-protein] synthase III
MERQTVKRSVWSALTLAGAAACLPTAAAEQATAAAGDGAAAHVVVRDAETGRLRAPTQEEARAHAEHATRTREQARSAGPQNASQQALVRQHRNGAKSVRMTDEMVSQVVAVRRASGPVEAYCVPNQAAAKATLAFTGSAKE